MTTQSAVHIDGEHLTYSQFADVVFRYVPIELTAQALERVTEAREFVKGLIEENRTVYGITTGFGMFSNRVIDPSQTRELQLNLIKSHACGVGEPLPEMAVRGMMLLRINALSKGHSGVRLETLQTLVQMLNHQIHPIIPSQGSLGASGDLAPLSHMCLPMLGIGDVIYKGERKSALSVLSEVGIEPIHLEAKEGLALINGTQMMCSLSALCVMAAEQILLSADIISAMTCEALEGIPRAYHPLLQQVRGQHGQILTAKNMLTLVQDSERTTQPGEKRVQDAYSLRCIPQVHGASKDAYQYVSSIVSREMNAATDNPLIFTEIDEAISGGNFHGQPLALASDFLTIALAEIANISERRTERLVNPQLSGLPAFLTHQGGLHSGYMILQYVAAALVSENKVLAHPASVDSIPSSANQEDHVSMGSIGARKCWKVIENVYKVLAIEYVCAAQALDFAAGKKCGQGTQIAYDLLRQHLPTLQEDREGHLDIETAASLLQSGQLLAAVREKVDLSL